MIHCPGLEARLPPVAVSRHVSAGVETALERFSDPALLAAGKVSIISLEAVQARFGRRWGLRSDQVYDFTARVLERGVGAQGFFLRVSASDFFIVHPDLSRVAGQAACLRYLREVLHHFLGEDQMAASGVLQVTRIVDGGIEACEVDDLQDQVALADGGRESAQAERRETPGDHWSVDRWTPFVAADGRELRVSASLEPVYELRRFTRIGFRMVRRVAVVRRGEEVELAPNQVARLSTADLLQIDMATVSRGVERLRSDGGQALSLIVPLSFTNLSSRKGRALLVRELKAAGALVKLGVICEVCDIEGAPAGALLGAASLVRPFSLLVIGRLTTPTPAAIGGLQGAGLQALSLECPPDLSEAEFVHWATTSVTAARRAAKSVLVYRANSPKRAATLGSLGATHASLVAC